MQYALLLCVARLFDLHKQEALTSLHHKKDLLKDLLGARGISHQLAIVMNDTTSHHNSKNLINMRIDAI
jgi:hypothetical protein